MIALFFSSIDVITANDLSDNDINNNIIILNNNNNIDLKNENYINTVDDGISNELNNNNTNVVKNTENADNINGVNNNNGVDVTNTLNVATNTHNVATNTITTPNTNPTTTTIDSKTTNSNKILAAGDVKPIRLSQKQILTASNSVYKYAIKHKVLPNFVTIGGYKFSMPEFMYLLSKTINSKYKKIAGSITVKYDVKNPSKPSGNNIRAKISSKNFNKYANNVAKYIEKHNQVPNFVTTSWGKMQYQAAIYEFSRLLRWSHLHKSDLPKSLSVRVSKSHKMNKVIPRHTNSVFLTNDSSKSKVPSISLNSKYEGESLIAFLSSSKNCQSTSAAIKSLARDITKNAKTELEKATAIFNWVRDKISYNFYYNTRKGAEKTLSSKSGNCVDQTHLLIALMRSSGIPAKYVNGKASFTSGNTYGHVWAQVLIGDTWLVADTTSSRNSLGVINNWNTKTVTIHGTYSSISF